MPQRLNPDKTYHQISVGPHRKMWKEFISFARWEATPLCELVSQAMASYGPFQEWRGQQARLTRRVRDR